MLLEKSLKEIAGRIISWRHKSFVMEKDVALNTLAKVRIFVWRLCLDAIPTMLNLSKSGVQVEPICPLCKDDVESIEHAIFKHDIASAGGRCGRTAPLA